MSQIGFDGTFFVTPEPFYQLYTVHFIINSHYFPVISVLLMGKTTKIYEKGLSPLIDAKKPLFDSISLYERKYAHSYGGEMFAFNLCRIDKTHFSRYLSPVDIVARTPHMRHKPFQNIVP